MSTSSWVYQAVGAARLAGFNVPSSMNAAVQFVMALNAASVPAGGMWKQWNPAGTGTGTFPYSGGCSGPNNWTNQGLLMRMALGDSPGSSVVESQLGFIMGDQSGVPRAIARFISADGKSRYHYYHTTRGLRLVGGSTWDEWLNPNPSYNGWQGYTFYVLKHLVDDGCDAEGNPMAYWSDLSLVSYGGYQKEAWITAFSLMMLSDAFDDTWLDEEFSLPGDGRCSYGYNNRLGQDRRTPAADTIIVMDYDNWLIDHDDVDEDDDESKIATRHGGKANALMGDGHVRPLRIEEITDGMWTVEPSD